MKKGILIVFIIANVVSLFCVLNPWYIGWQTKGIIFFTLEVFFLVLFGLPVFVYHMRKGLQVRQALVASLDSMMSFLSSWV